MKTSVSEIYAQFKGEGLLLEVLGENQELTGVAPAQDCVPGDLVFADNASYLDNILAKKPSAAVINAEVREKLPKNLPDDITFILAKNVGLATAKIRQKYADRDLYAGDGPRIHPRAIVHENVRVPEDAVIGPGVVVEANVQMGPRCVIMANSVIEHDVIMGADVIIHPNVTIGYATEIGDEVIIQSGSVVGAEGFGFAQDETGQSYRIPQTGKVVLEERVHLGANNCVDRAAFKETRIGAGTKMDNFCHIAHNVQTGKDCLFTAGFIVAGSTTIGDRVIASGQVGILDHLKVSSDTVFVHRAGVTDDVTSPGVYAGLPLLPLREYMRNTAITRKITELRDKVRKLEKLFSSK